MELTEKDLINILLYAKLGLSENIKYPLMQSDLSEEQEKELLNKINGYLEV